MIRWCLADHINRVRVLGLNGIFAGESFLSCRGFFAIGIFSAGGGGMLLENFLQLVALGDCRRIGRVCWNADFLVWRFGQVEQFASVGQFKACIADVGFAVEFDIHPVARLARFAFDLRGEAAAVERYALGQFCAAQFGERGKEIAEVDQVVIHFSGGRDAGPVDQ